MIGRRRGSGRRPCAELVRRVAAEEAAAMSVKADHLFAMTKGADALVARRKAWRRVLAETQCSINGLADVWGCDRQAIWRVVKGRVAA